MSGQLRLKAASLGGDITLAPADTANNVVVTVPAVTSTLLNDQSNIEAQTKTALNASGSAPIYACRAWVNFDGTGTPAIRGSGNVSSITDGGVGTYTVNFTTAMQDVNYAYFVQANPIASIEQHADAGTAATTSLGVLTRNNANVFYDADVVRVSIFR
jgi:hypothetical protein